MLLISERHVSVNKVTFDFRPDHRHLFVKLYGRYLKNGFRTTLQLTTLGRTCFDVLTFRNLSTLDFDALGRRKLGILGLSLLLTASVDDRIKTLRRTLHIAWLLLRAEELSDKGQRIRE